MGWKKEGGNRAQVDNRDTVQQDEDDVASPTVPGPALPCPAFLPCRVVTSVLSSPSSNDSVSAPKPPPGQVSPLTSTHGRRNMYLQLRRVQCELLANAPHACRSAKSCLFCQPNGDTDQSWVRLPPMWRLPPCCVSISTEETTKHSRHARAWA